MNPQQPDASATANLIQHQQQSGSRRPRSPSNQVRLNAARVVYSRWRILFFWSAIITNFIQLSVSVGALLYSMGRSCDSPLRTFLIIYASLLTTNIGVCIYQYRHPTSDSDSITTMTGVGRFVKQLSETCDLVTILSYILGNVWVSSAKTCSATAPALYYTALAWVIWGYVLILLPILVLSCIILCLPCFIIFFNVFHLGNPASSRQGASSQQIDHLPVLKYQPANQDKATTTDQIVIDEEDARCSICLGEYQSNDPLRRLPCQHHFHKDCVDQWLGISATCPLCVRSIVEPDTAQETV